MNYDIHEKDFKRLVIRAIALPVFLMLFIAALLVWQINSLLEASHWVDHTDEVLASANHIHKLLIDMETGLRGYLLTGDSEFLEPYTHAQTEITPDWQQLQQLVAADPTQLQHVTSLERLQREWLDYAQQEIVTHDTHGDFLALVTAKVGKHHMDQIRVEFHAFISHAEELKKIRTAQAQSTARFATASSVGLTLLLGTILAFLSKRQLTLLSASYRLALRTADQRTHEIEKLNLDLEHRVQNRTAELEQTARRLADTNKELEAFSYSVSHDLRAPLRHIAGFVTLVHKDRDSVYSPETMENLAVIQNTAKRAGTMIDDLLAFSRFGRSQMRFSLVSMDELVQTARSDLAPETVGRNIEWRVGPLPPVEGDPALLRIVLQNLLGNALKYSRTRTHAVITVGSKTDGDETIFFVKDNGVGFDPRYVDKLFGVFQRLHAQEEFEGTGIGLANVRRIISRHGGRTWAEGTLDHGAALYFSLPISAQKGNAA